MEKHLGYFSRRPLSPSCRRLSQPPWVDAPLRAAIKAKHDFYSVGKKYPTQLRPWRIMLEKVADSARKAVKLAEPYKPYGGQFLEFCSISLSTYQTCIKLPENVLNSANFSAGIIRQGLTQLNMHVQYIDLNGTW